MLLDLLGSAQTIIAFLVAVGIVIFVHEFGHYFCARLCSIHAEAFSIGFGPAILKRTDSRGTIWKISLLPLGGYVKFRSRSTSQSTTTNESSEMTEQSGYLEGVSLAKRASIVAAGPFANFILSTIIFASLITWTGVVREPIVIDEFKPLPEGNLELRIGDQLVAINDYSISNLGDLYRYGRDVSPESRHIYRVVRDEREIEVVGPYPTPPIIAGVSLRSAAEEAGFAVGDVILAVDLEPIKSFRDLQNKVQNSGGNPMRFQVWRNGSSFDVVVSGRLQDVSLGSGDFQRQVVLGVSLGAAFLPSSTTPGPLDALAGGVFQTWFVISESFSGLANVILGSISSCNIQGVIGIAQISGSAASQGVDVFLSLVAVLSVAIGFLNLLPIPVLDGGYLAIFAFEALTGRKPRRPFLRIAFTAGLFIVMAIVVFALYLDITCVR